MNPMRNSLVDLVSKAKEKCGSMNCLDCKYKDIEAQNPSCYSYLIADCLIENGICCKEFPYRRKETQDAN